MTAAVVGEDGGGGPPPAESAPTEATFPSDSAATGGDDDGPSSGSIGRREGMELAAVLADGDEDDLEVRVVRPDREDEESDGVRTDEEEAVVVVDGEGAE